MNESCGNHGGGSRANRNGSGRVAAQLHDAREVLLDGCPGVRRHIVGRAIDLVDRHFLRAVAAAGIGFTLRVHETWSASTALSSDRNAHARSFQDENHHFTYPFSPDPAGNI